MFLLKGTDKIGTEKVEDHIANNPWVGYGVLRKDHQDLLFKEIRWTSCAVFGALTLPILLASPLNVPWVLSAFVQALWPATVIYLAALSYSILNDHRACQKNIGYFILGHQKGQYSLIQSNRPDVVARAWGIFASAPLAGLAAATFFVTSLALTFTGHSLPMFLLPVMMMALLSVLPIAEYQARKVEKEILEMDRESFESFTIRMGRQLNRYQRDNNPYALSLMQSSLPKDFKSYHRLNTQMTSQQYYASWMGNGYRNGTGYFAAPVVGAVTLAAWITFALRPSWIPSFFMQRWFSQYLSLGCALAVALFVGYSCLDVSRRHEEQDPKQPLCLDFSKNVTVPMKL